MNGKILKYVAYGLGAVTLLAGSFFLFAALSGTPLSEMQGVGAAFPEKESTPANASQALPHPQDELDGDRRSSEQILQEAASPLKAFLLPSGFSAAELSELESALKKRMAELDRRSRDLDEREKQLEEDRALYDELFAELEVLRNNLLEQSEEAEARSEEVAAKEAALQQSRRANFAALAKTFYGEDAGKPEEVAPLLVKYSPEDAALILIALPDERAAKLVTAVMRQAGGDERAMALQRAYMDARAGAAAK